LHLRERKRGGRTVDEQGGVTTVIDDQVAAGHVGPGEHLLRAPPVLVQGLALPGEHGGGVARDGSGGVVLEYDER